VAENPAGCLTCDVKFHDQQCRKPPAAAQIRDQLTSEITIKTIATVVTASSRRFLNCRGLLACLKFVLSAQAVEWGQTFAGYRIERLLGRLGTP
jgi:hypothetical protein